MFAFLCNQLLKTNGRKYQRSYNLFHPGGTPYSGMRTREVKSRILQGLRPPQTRYLSDALYQLLLMCWMTDPSERPDFASILSSLSEWSTQQQVSLRCAFFGARGAK